ncbi:MAG: hypothetical protein Kow0029_18320 [Candidatus Rifleibacteriota bacterium]
MDTEKRNDFFSQEILCRQLHALYERLLQRKNEILAHPDFNPGNDALNDELSEIYEKIRLVQECFEKFCPS